MAGSFVKVNPEEITDNVFKIIGSDWMLVTAGTLEDYNTMTASWGTMGVLWGKRICICFIRPSRYTYQFMEKNALFTLSFFGEEQREIDKAAPCRYGEAWRHAAGLSKRRAMGRRLLILVPKLQLGNLGSPKLLLRSSCEARASQIGRSQAGAWERELNPAPGLLYRW